MTVVLHVAGDWGSGEQGSGDWDAEARAAALQFVRATPEHEHHLLRGTGRAGLAAAGLGAEDVRGFSSVGVLPAGAASWRAIRDAADAVAADVVHAHSAGAGLAARIVLGDRSTRHRAGRHLVYSPHCFGFERLDLSAARRFASRLAERLLVRGADTVVACSPAETVAARRLGAHRVTHVPVVARVPALAMLEHRQPGRIVAVGRVGARRDPDFFRATIRLLRQIRRSGIDARWIGEVDDRLAAQRLERVGVPVTGWMSSFDALRALGSAGVYLHTARWGAQPLDILAAVELGVPVLARDVPALHGLNATPGLTTPARLAAAAAELLAGGDLARHANLAAWQRRLATCTPPNQSRGLAAAYRPLGAATGFAPVPAELGELSLAAADLQFDPPLGAPFEPPTEAPWVHGPPVLPDPPAHGPRPDETPW